MRNFTYYNPVNIVFGKGSIVELKKLIPTHEKILMTYGGGSIKRNGVHDQVKDALQNHEMLEFGGIEPNPQYETLMKAVRLAREEYVTYLLAVGGGSVLDGTKFIAAAIPFNPGKEWDIVEKRYPLTTALPIGSVLTLPATGSEMNAAAVISRAEAGKKLAFSNPRVYPKFSILDPETSYTLPERQTANGVVDAFVHVMEQYLTYPVNAPLQDRQAEAILQTLVEEGPKALSDAENYNVRANIMWATQALNGLIGCGVPQDWGTHMIGHEITAVKGLDHARTLAIVLPAIMDHERSRKKEKILQYGERIWGITGGTEDEQIDKTIEKTREFFESMGIPTRLGDYDITPVDVSGIGTAIEANGMHLGEYSDIRKKEVDEILALAW